MRAEGRRRQGVERATVSLPADLIPARYELNSVLYELADGRSKPIIARCIPEDGGPEIDLVVKLRDPLVNDGTPWAQCLARELIGSVLARFLGVRVPDFGLVEITPEAVGAERNPARKARLAASEGWNFGCVFIGDASPAQIPDVPAERWAELLNFDALVWNTDRYLSNPNVVANASGLYAIDHGMVCPSWTFHLDSTIAESIWPEHQIRLHGAFQRVQGLSAPFPISARWVEDLIESTLGELEAMMPGDWSDSADRQGWREFLGGRHRVADTIRTRLEQVTR